MWTGLAADVWAPNSTVCRGCMTTDEPEAMLLLSSDQMHLYTCCTSIQISDCDTLPKKFCQICCDTLNKFVSFKQQCIRTNEKLLQYEANNKIDYDQIIEYENIIKSQDISDNFFDVPVLYNDDSTSSKCKPLHEDTTKRQRKQPIFEHICPICDKKFAYPERLEAHKLTHEGGKEEIICKICNRTFKQWLGLRRHTKFVHEIFNECYNCDICGKTFKSAMTVRRHKNVHKDIKDFVCHVCGSSFRSSAGLQIHLDTHKENRERNYECNECGKKFLSNRTLASHTLRHKERRYTCDVCSFRFYDKSDLARHMLIHIGVKPYTCEICNNSYSTKSFLIEHNRMHTGEKPFKCEMCPMSFISKRRLIEHRRTHTGVKPYKCKECGMGFVQRGALTRHLKVHKKNTIKMTKIIHKDQIIM